MAFLDPLRHAKNRVRRALGRYYLRRAAKTLSPSHVNKMRRGLGIQLTQEEMLTVAEVVRSTQMCNFLVFGTGHDSEFWHRLNQRGLTVFLEDDLLWVDRSKKVVPELNIFPITYGTRRHEWEALLMDLGRLSDGLVPIAMTHAWQVILVDGPRGYEASDPGRMKSIYFASQLISAGGHVFVHDCDRIVEQTYCDKFFTGFQLVATVGRMRHYRKLEMLRADT